MYCEFIVNQKVFCFLNFSKFLFFLKILLFCFCLFFSKVNIICESTMIVPWNHCGCSLILLWIHNLGIFSFFSQSKQNLWIHYDYTLKSLWMYSKLDFLIFEKQGGFFLSKKTVIQVQSLRHVLQHLSLFKRKQANEVCTTNKRYLIFAGAERIPCKIWILHDRSYLHPSIH
jgi:hypothetical protein